jgi:alpha-ketoglutarate-dependent 2,4-dichlorophenoxyacetate dioxygenase
MELVKLGPDFGAEVRGVTIQDVARDPDIYRQVRAAFEEHSVLLFRGQELTDEDQLAYSARFGPLEPTKVNALGSGTYYVHLRNIDPETGKIVPTSHRLWLTNKANQFWHTDSSFKAVPALTSILSGRIIPPSGGETEFVSTRRAWERLPESRRAKLRDLVALHSFATSRDKVSPTLMNDEERRSLPPIRWRLTWRNPVNGKESLYIASHIFGIEGMADAEARALIDELTELATEPGREWQHVWRAGDVVMWDNRATMHRGRPWPEDVGRYMVRTTISATAADGLELVRPMALAA